MGLIIRQDIVHTGIYGQTLFMGLIIMQDIMHTGIYGVSHPTIRQDIMHTGINRKSISQVIINSYARLLAAWPT